MKQVFLTFTTLLVLVTSKNANAQTTNAAMVSSAGIQQALLLSSESSKIDAADITMTAVKDFQASFKSVTHQQWYEVSDGFIAEFTKDKIPTRVAYDKKGRWHCTVRTLNETQLPADVRDLVKSRYYDFNILVAYEIKHENTAYVLKIEDSKTLKMLRVVDGEIEVITDNTKE